MLERPKCPRCSGTGERVHRKKLENGEVREEPYQCLRCQGTGFNDNKSQTRIKQQGYFVAMQRLMNAYAKGGSFLLITPLGDGFTYVNQEMDIERACDEVPKLHKCKPIRRGD